MPTGWSTINDFEIGGVHDAPSVHITPNLSLCFSGENSSISRHGIGTHYSTYERPLYS